MKRERIIQQLEVQLAVIEKTAAALPSEGAVGYDPYVDGYWFARQVCVDDILEMLREG